MLVADELHVALFAAGWLAGRIRKDVILRVLSVIQLLAISLTSYVLINDEMDSQSKFNVLCGALALWGVAQVRRRAFDHGLLIVS